MLVRHTQTEPFSYEGCETNDPASLVGYQSVDELRQASFAVVVGVIISSEVVRTRDLAAEEKIRQLLEPHKAAMISAYTKSTGRVRRCIDSSGDGDNCLGQDPIPPLGGRFLVFIQQQPAEQEFIVGGSTVGCLAVDKDGRLSVRNSEYRSVTGVFAGKSVEEVAAQPRNGRSCADHLDGCLFLGGEVLGGFDEAVDGDGNLNCGDGDHRRRTCLPAQRRSSAPPRHRR